MRRENLTLLALLLPAGAFFAAFFLLPLARLFLVGGSGKGGFANYATIITDRNHFASLLATLALAAATTIVTLIISGIAGVFLQRNKFRGNIVAPVDSARAKVPTTVSPAPVTSKTWRARVGICQ